MQAGQLKRKRAAIDRAPGCVVLCLRCHCRQGDPRHPLDGPAASPVFAGQQMEHATQDRQTWLGLGCVRISTLCVALALALLPVKRPRGRPVHGMLIDIGFESVRPPRCQQSAKGPFKLGAVLS